ncbi:uncharacterized protein LOC115928804 [Strongylocentrotus purpuratus]|uniref:BD-FAE-like domain-containing protein n=1 Tax=Strongylocentrotus purpuratus TaxID=7668 RepID=A0A7M7PJX9_STRPU|nr:uncharacterized protein LOC115928804 [Strongylocentrotus purpuratus]
MENRLGYSVLRNFDYSQPFEEGVANRGRQEHQSAHILSKTCLDLFLPSSGNPISTVESKKVSDDFINDGRKLEGPSLDSGGTLGGNVVVKSKMQKSQNSCKSTEDAEVESPISSCTNEPITTQKEEKNSDKNVRKRDANGEIGGKRPRPPPLVVFAYGGGWRRGDKQTWRHYMSRWECNFSLAAMVGRDRLYSNIGESFASRGFPCAILSYPIAPTPWLINLIEMAISLSYALAYWILAALLLFIVLEVLPISCISLDSRLRVPVMPLIAGVIIVAQWITLAIMISRELYLERRHQSGTQKNISSKMPIVVALVATITTVSTLDISTLAENNTLALSISGILVFTVQCLIFYFRQTTTFDLGSSLVAGPKDQAECVTLALKWLVDYGQSTGHFDPESIILAGHSAGGHLVSLVALDHHYLTDVGISPQVIKGVISLSAVHDLQSISKGFNYHIYLKPAFGTDPTYWTSMSPIEYVKLLDENKNPTPTSTSSEEEESSSSLPTSSAAASSSSTSPLILPTSSSSKTITTITTSITTRSNIITIIRYDTNSISPSSTPLPHHQSCPRLCFHDQGWRQDVLGSIQEWVHYPEEMDGGMRSFQRGEEVWLPLVSVLDWGSSKERRMGAL